MIGTASLVGTSPDHAALDGRPEARVERRAEMTDPVKRETGRDWGPVLVGIASVVLVAVVIAILIIVAKPGQKHPPTQGPKVTSSAEPSTP